MNELSIEPGVGSTAQGGRFTLRYIVYFFSWLCMWQGSTVAGSIFQLDFLSVVPGVMLYETMLFLTILAVLVERWLSNDYTLSRSYFSAPLILLFAALIFSWIRGEIMLQQFRFVYEAHEAILIPISFFLFLNAFRDVKERKVMVGLFMIASLMKAADAAWIKAFPTDPNSLWGVLLMWRDGYILCVGIVGAMILAHYQGVQLKRLRNFSLIVVPFIAYGLMISYRRTFILALFVASVLLFVTLGRGRRGKHLRNFLLMLLVIAIAVLATDPLGIIARMAGAFMPMEEGSSYLRIIEYPNILRNIADHPLLGVPVGVEWHQYWRMPLFGNSTTFGTHNTYLYWPLRMGVIGAFGFLWLLARIWKAVLINWRLQKTEEDYFYNHFLLYAFIIYNFACFFGLMYSDSMSILTGVMLVMLHLQMKKMTGLDTLKKVDFIKTLQRREIVMRPPIRLSPKGAKLAEELQAKQA